MKDLKKVSKTVKLNLTKLLAEAVKLVENPKSGLESSQKTSRKQNKQVKNSLFA